MKRIFVTDAFFKSTKLEEIKLGMSLFHLKWLEEDSSGIIRDERGFKMGNNFDEALSKLNERNLFVEVPKRWDWTENMNPIESNADYDLLCQYLPYFKGKDAIEKVAKIKKIKAEIFG